jgi:hypothetical protein
MGTTHLSWVVVVLSACTLTLAGCSTPTAPTGRAIAPSGSSNALGERIVQASSGSPDDLELQFRCVPWGSTVLTLTPLALPAKGERRKGAQATAEKGSVRSQSRLIPA